MFWPKIFVRVQTFQRVPPLLPRNFCQPALDLVLVPQVVLTSHLLDQLLGHQHAVLAHGGHR